MPPAGETLPREATYRVWGNVTSPGAPQAAFNYGGALLSEIHTSGRLRSLHVPRDVALEVRAEVVAGNATYFGIAPIPPTTAEVSSVQLTLARVGNLFPFITYPNGIASVKVGTTVLVKVEFTGPQPDRVQLYADQILIGELSGQRAFYAFAWDTTGLGPATRRLNAVAHDGTSVGRSSEVLVLLVN